MLPVAVIWCKKEALKTIAIQKHHYVLQNENIQVTGFTILIFPIDCSVRVNHKNYGLFNGDIQL